MKKQILSLSIIAAAALAGSVQAQVQVIASFGGDYVSADQNSQAPANQDILGVPTASDSIRQIGGFGVVNNPTIGANYTGPTFEGGAQVVKFGLNSTSGQATASVINDAGGDYINLFSQSPNGTTNSHLNYIFSMDVNTTYSNITSFSGRTAGNMGAGVVSRFMVKTSGGDIYLSNTSISGGFGGNTWSISDLTAENWALFTPGTNDWRGNFGSLTFNTNLSTQTITSVGWFASSNTGTAGFTNARLTIREFEVAIPEPSAAVLIALGLTALVVLRRRQRA